MKDTFKRIMRNYIFKLSKESNGTHRLILWQCATYFIANLWIMGVITDNTYHLYRNLLFNVYLRKTVIEEKERNYL